MPKPYTPCIVHLSVGDAATEQDGEVLKTSLHCAEEGPVHWTVQF